ncbi:MAG: flagellar motor switch protein FliG [Planctomycetes bacterium]|nr:flagellar motor switch protein FliG [Planctomycetota bacterium]
MAAPDRPLLPPTADAAGLRKAALFLVSIDTDTAARVLTQLEREDQELIAREIARLGEERPTKDERDKIFQEFKNVYLAQQFVEQGGIGYARQLLEKFLPTDEVRKIIDSIESSMKSTPFGFLQRTDARNLITFIQDEHPQTIALIIAYLTSLQGAEVLEALPLKKQQEVIKRLATMEHTNPEIVHQVEKALETRLSTFVTAELRKTGGVGAAAEVLNLVQRSTERNILEGLEEEDPEMVEQIRRLMFTFDDILRVNDRGVQNLLKNIDTSQLAMALKTASPELKEKFLKNMSQRAADLIKEEMEFMGPVRLSDVEAAQQAIVDVVRRLEEQGELIIEGRGGAEEIVV